jgi:hypothetical protein
MRTTAHTSAGAASILALLLGGCVVDQEASSDGLEVDGEPADDDRVTDITGQDGDAGDAHVLLSPATATGTTQILTSLETPTGSTIQFIEVRDVDRTGVLMVEEGNDGTLVMDRIISAAGGELSAADLYASLLEPSLTDAAIPARLRELVAPSPDLRPVGWARDLIANNTVIALAAGSEVACNNANFTSSISGGFLPKLFKRLDTGPQYHPGIWPTYDFDGSWHYWYQVAADNTPLWRGKVCGKAGFHPSTSGGLPSVPVLQFLYRAGQSWAQAGERRTFGSNNRVWAWMYDGGLGAIDWRIMIYDAYLFDEFDVMMSWQ